MAVCSVQSGCRGDDRTNRSELVPELDFDLLNSMVMRLWSSILFEGNAYERFPTG
ncbi:MAG: hypothetical protein HC789_09005 [Microcoleus sp. CSU_2_2]|nr:hypothetical protein [Microcoleus sp. SU_5_3]NJS10499.1 hypothetical protein [Microcoleus sp. CSU_2_2]